MESCVLTDSDFPSAGQFYVAKICCMGSIKYYPYCSYCFIQEKL